MRKLPGNAKVALAVACVMSCSSVSLLALGMRPWRGPQGPNECIPQSDAFVWTKHCARLTPAQFRLMYRMDARSFDALLDKIWPHLVSDEKQSRCSRKGVGAVPPHAKLAITLRFLAGGLVHDLLLNYYPISKATVYKVIWQTIDAINAEFPVEFPIDDEEKLKEIERGFRAKSPHQFFSGCVGALDGVHFRQKSPGKAVHNPARYYVARKRECGPPPVFSPMLPYSV